MAFSAQQAEGAAPASDWRHWEDIRLAPHSAEGSGFGVNYRDDLRLFAHHKLAHVRLTLDWARIEPSNDVVDAWAVEHYQSVLGAAADAGLAVWATLVDRSMPGWFSLDERGFRDRRTRSYLWPRHVERCAELFGDLVHAWVPIARPLRLARAGYLIGTAPPGRQDPARFTEALAGLHLGALEAWRVLRGTRPVATCYDLAEIRPAPEDVRARGEARVVDGQQWVWTAPFRDGVLEVIGQPAHQVAVHQEAFDILGVTIEDRVTVDGTGGWKTSRAPEDIGALVRRAAEEGPERPIVVLGQHVDSPEELGRVAEEVADAIDDGVDLRGWFAEPAIDGYEGRAGFSLQRGLFDNDRHPRRTADLLTELASADHDELDLSQAVLLADRGDGREIPQERD